MTIDGAKAFIIKRRILDCFLDCDECANYGCNVHIILAMLEELKWYRNQDLIKRQDVLKVYNSDLCLDFDREMCESTPNCRCCNIMRIPKAEPPHATVDERNGDCETCKHYGDSRRETECDSCYEMDKYEPYIPEE